MFWKKWLSKSHTMITPLLGEISVIHYYQMIYVFSDVSRLIIYFCSFFLNRIFKILISYILRNFWLFSDARIHIAFLIWSKLKKISSHEGQLIQELNFLHSLFFSICNLWKNHTAHLSILKDNSLLTPMTALNLLKSIFDTIFISFLLFFT